VYSSGCEDAVCLFVSVWVSDVSVFITEGGEEDIVLAGGVGAECGGYGVGEGEGGMWWNMEHASRWARTRHQSVGGRSLVI
jgi:hypothetical protein